MEQVEVLKGPASALCGAQAIGGVVNGLTRKSRGAVRSSLLAEYGSYQTTRVGGATGGNAAKNLDFDLSLAFLTRPRITSWARAACSAAGSTRAAPPKPTPTAAP